MFEVVEQLKQVELLVSVADSVAVSKTAVSVGMLLTIHSIESLQC